MEDDKKNNGKRPQKNKNGIRQKKMEDDLNFFWKTRMKTKISTLIGSDIIVNELSTNQESILRVSKKNKVNKNVFFQSLCV